MRLWAVDRCVFRLRGLGVLAKFRGCRVGVAVLMCVHLRARW